LALLAALPSAAQTQLVSDHPAVKAAVEQFLSDQAVAGPAKNTGVRLAATSPTYAGRSLLAPPVVLRLNRSQFNEKEVLQASLVVLPEINKGGNPGPVYVSVLSIHIDSGSTRGTYAGRHVLLEGEIIPLQTYIFDGYEPSGMYAYVVMIHDASTGQLLAMPGTSFVLRTFRQSDSRGYIRVDSGEVSGDRHVTLRGNFGISPNLGQFVVIGGQKFPIVKSSGDYAVVDLGSPWALPAGIYDITVVAHTPGNTAYDSTTTPCVLRIFLPVPPGKG
jgi:hypothetical protein